MESGGYQCALGGRGGGGCTGIFAYQIETSLLNPNPWILENCVHLTFCLNLSLRAYTVYTTCTVHIASAVCTVCTACTVHIASTVCTGTSVF